MQDKVIGISSSNHFPYNLILGEEKVLGLVRKGNVTMTITYQTSSW
jgi:hypothetical protein